MTVAALITWTVTAFAGLYLLAIWLIEYDVSAPGGAPTRLPRTVISGHVLLASSGLVVWVSYLIVDRDLLAWIRGAARPRHAGPDGGAGGPARRGPLRRPRGGG
jgi:hypothetical protein